MSTTVDPNKVRLLRVMAMERARRAAAWRDTLGVSAAAGSYEYLSAHAVESCQADIAGYRGFAGASPPVRHACARREFDPPNNVGADRRRDLPSA